jgi:hypothetical protein
VILLSKVKKFMAGVAKTAAVDVLRGYIAKRVRALQVDDIINAIESNDADLFGKLTEKDKKLFIATARRFGEYLDLLTVKNVMQWMVEDAPLHAGVIYGHPNGLKWLERVLEQIRTQAMTYARSETVEVELVPVTASNA